MDKSNKALVSIVFTSYNHKEYLRQALDSLVGQTYPNLEIIIIDDCSTDGSQEILKEYSHYPNINLKLQTENSGSYVKASNYGASFANGEYILFAQCDDFAESNQIEVLMEQFEKNPSAGVVFSTSKLVDEKGIAFSDDFIGREKSFKNAVSKKSLISGKEMKEFLSFSCVIPNLSAALIKRELFTKVNGLSDRYLVVADWEFWLDMTELTDFVYVSMPLNYFRQHATTIRSSIKMKTQIIEMFKMFYNHISKNNLTPSQVQKLKIGAGAVWFSYYLENKKTWRECFSLVRNEINATERNNLYYLFLGVKKHVIVYLNKRR
ncbi:Glycosyl transferase family 2 [Flavobacterium flevense]|uniref:Glycosyl transferase n=1 Tax=Flavobacterium flevense TaxID=983 RepID=A0A4Y4AY92_9FLAO|nr:glycosyltransferase [Flavobacterium flevense]GEC73208.1 glycosyl transferase [Flavobacterium flevense]SHL99430.1 Glycosyl transferase family 2 [Flavobacterium flevense]